MTAAASVLFRRSITVRHEVDVFVAGGGPAGVASTLAAARQGRSVFLAEAHTCFGGMGTAGLVPMLAQFGDGEHFLAGGVGREIHGLMHDRGGVGPGGTARDDPYGGITIRTEVLKRIYDDLIVDSGAGFSLQAQVIGVESDGPRLTHAILSGKSGLFAVAASVFIDCTGDGDLAAWAGAPFEKGDEDGNVQAGTLCSLWTDVDWEAVDEARRKGQNAQGTVPRAIADGALTVPDRHLPGMWRVGRRVGGGNIGHTFGVDGTDERSLTRALLEGRRILDEYERFYKQYLKGYEEMELVATASLLGLRETRRILGDYVLCVEDFKRRAVFDDEIGRCNYPVDIHASRPDPDSFARYEGAFTGLRCGTGESYGVPYRTLTPRGLENVLVAGRCVSTDRCVQGSIRVMPGCFITGQAAGVAAALASEKGVSTRGIDVAELQSRLKDMGAFLPNA